MPSSLPARRSKALPERKIKHYGWRPDLPDPRDHLYSAPHEVLKTLPPRVDLTEAKTKAKPNFPGILDQLALGSCTANAIAVAMFHAARVTGRWPKVGSRLFLYYLEREMEGTADSDSGAYIRDGIKACVNVGVPAEEKWPYDIGRFAEKPPPQAYRGARAQKAVRYARVDQTLSQLKGCLAEGHPFVYGFTVFEEFESQEVADTGIVPMPGPGSRDIGGHAVCAVGYDDDQQRMKVRNSWGEGWGDAGHFWMPYAYLLDANLADDFWTVRAAT